MNTIRELLRSASDLGYAVAFCERTGYGMYPPPPNRVLWDGLVETRASRRLTKHWRRLGDNWDSWALDRRRAEVAEFQSHCNRVHGRPALAPLLSPEMN